MTADGTIEKETDWERIGLGKKRIRMGHVDLPLGGDTNGLDGQAGIVKVGEQAQLQIELAKAGMHG